MCVPLFFFPFLFPVIAFGRCWIVCLYIYMYTYTHICVSSCGYIYLYMEISSYVPKSCHCASTKVVVLLLTRRLRYQDCKPKTERGAAISEARGPSDYKRAKLQLSQYRGNGWNRSGGWWCTLHTAEATVLHSGPGSHHCRERPVLLVLWPA